MHTYTKCIWSFLGRKNSWLLTWRKAAKDAILVADAFYRVFSFFSYPLKSKGPIKLVKKTTISTKTTYFKEVSLSIRHHMIRCILFAGVRKERILQCARVPEIVSSGTYNLHRKSSIHLFQTTAFST